jgi:purine-binding chemotaxis protein CheW
MVDPDQVSMDWTEGLFREEEEDTLKDKYLAFRIGEQDYMIEVGHVLEIIGMQKITEVPDMPDFVQGVIDLRGKVIPAVDVRVRFNLEQRDYDDRTCIIVVALEEVAVGLIVDSVAEVLVIPDDCIDPPPTVNRGPGSRFIMGMGKTESRVKILIDIGQLLGDEAEQLERAAAG